MTTTSQKSKRDTGHRVLWIDPARDRDSDGVWHTAALVQMPSPSWCLTRDVKWLRARAAEFAHIADLIEDEHEDEQQ